MSNFNIINERTFGILEFMKTYIILQGNQGALKLIFLSRRNMRFAWRVFCYNDSEVP